MFKNLLKRRFTISSVAAISLHLILFLSTKVNIFPELFVYPWLITKGLVPYKDFFDHHGFLPYYLLAYLTVDKSLVMIVVFYHLLQLGNLVLVLAILRKSTSWLWFTICGILFVLLNFYFSDTNFWFEHFYIFISLLIFYISQFTNDFRGKLLLVSGLIFLTTIIKPTFGIMLVPYLLYFKSAKPLLYLILYWVILLIAYSFNSTLIQMIEYLFIFNRNAIVYIKQYYGLGVELSVLKMFLLTSVISLSVYSFFVKKPKIFILINLLSYLFFLQGLSRINLLPAIPFFVILIGYSGTSNNKFIKWSYLFIIIILCVFFYIKTKHQYFAVKRNLPLIESTRVQSCMKELINKGITKKKTVYFDTPEYYYLLDKKPSTFYLIDLDFITRYRKDFETRTISDIERNQTAAVMLRNFDKRTNKLPLLQTYITAKYKRIDSTPCFTYFTRK